MFDKKKDIIDALEKVIRNKPRSTIQYVKI